MTFRETLREFLRRTREILDNNRAEGNISWIDDVMYFIEGKTRIRITEHFPDKGKRVGNLIENVISNEAAAMPRPERIESDSTEKASYIYKMLWKTKPTYGII